MAIRRAMVSSWAIVLVLGLPTAVRAENVTLVRTKQGGEYYGTILLKTDTSLVFRPVKGANVVIPYSDITEVKTLSEKLDEKTPAGNPISVQVNPVIQQNPSITVGAVPGYRPEPPGTKSAAGGFLLSFLTLPGAGQFYGGDNLAGAIFMISDVLLNGLGWPIALSGARGGATFEVGIIVIPILDGALRIASGVHAAVRIDKRNDELRSRWTPPTALRREIPGLSSPLLSTAARQPLGLSYTFTF